MVMVTEHHHQESGSPNGGALKRNNIDSTTKSCHYSNGKFCCDCLRLMWLSVLVY